MANAQTRASDRWHKKKGITPKTYKLPIDVVEAFAEACEVNGITQSAQLTKYMKYYAKRADVEI